ncbi:MAG: hypothetical protein AB1798_22115, partial [Spirochaetota bacterium]
ESVPVGVFQGSMFTNCSVIGFCQVALYVGIPMEPMVATLMAQAAVQAANARNARELLPENQYEVMTEQQRQHGLAIPLRFIASRLR